ncbi:hypothetical protein THTE_2531 [Thermogutta terrifontis]|jgi:DNA integrity scanning protein DisA with diadenylate cyclase activity|uniref:DAC domain-containing protein n=1 Tax=Thermogutta terrifontis TaxID=1331910 RepID=A0A286RGQ4_9BACT|nr:hypothetical protein THTE_2531 [Thermogutta terrifontis]
MNPEARTPAATDSKSPATSPGGETLRLTENVKLLLEHAAAVAKAAEAAAILILWPGKADWSRVTGLLGDQKLIVAVDTPAQAEPLHNSKVHVVITNMPESSPQDRLAEALVECVTEEYVAMGNDLVAVYGAFDATSLDTLSLFHLSDYLGRLTVRELRQLKTDIPVETLKLVINLAIEIGREGREGKPVGTIFVIGDTRRVLAHTRPLGFDPVRGYSKRERNLFDAKVREGIKEIAQLDGAFIISKDGYVVAACRHIDCSADGISLSKGLGSRHWAAAAITRRTKAVAVCVSQSSGTVRVFHDGEVRMRIEPERKRVVVWRDTDGNPETAR